MDKKRCTKCGVAKPVAEFRAASRIKRDGTHSLASWCIQCANKYSRVQYRVNPEKHAQAVRKWRKVNPGKHRAYQARWLEENREKCRERIKTRRKENRFASALHNSRKNAKRHSHKPCNASIAEVEAAFTGRCHVCGIEESQCEKRLSLDHDHESGVFRGFLCNWCNSVLGYVNDSADRLLALAMYLDESHKEREEVQRME